MVVVLSSYLFSSFVAASVAVVVAVVVVVIPSQTNIQVVAVLVWNSLFCLSVYLSHTI